MLLAIACVCANSGDVPAQSPSTDSHTVAVPTGPADSTTEVVLQPPLNSTLEIRVARRPWLIEKLIKPEPAPSIKMNPPNPPAELPDPPSMSAAASGKTADGWFRRGSLHDTSDAEAPDQADLPKEQTDSSSPTKAGVGNDSNRLRLDDPQRASGETQGSQTPNESDVFSSDSTTDRSKVGSPTQQANESNDETNSDLTPVQVRDLRIRNDGTPIHRSPQAGRGANRSDETSGSRTGSADSASQYVGSEEPAEPLDYVGYPLTKIRLTNSVYRMQNSIRQCLGYYYARPEVANTRSNWGMLHSIMVYGSDTKVLVGSKSYSAIGWIAGNNPCRGQTLLTTQGGKIAAKSGVGLQGHQAQMLAVFSLCDVPAEYPLYADDQRYTVQDLVDAEMLACKSGEELTFTLIGLAHYLDTSLAWKSANGEIWDFQRLIREELAQPIVGAACGGTHRLMGFAHALRKRRAEGQPITGQWKRAERFTQDFVAYAYSIQNRDGSMSTDWFEGREDTGDLDRKIQTTGHIVEWLLTVTPDSELQNPRLVSAVRFLLASMYNERDHDWSIGPKGHALRSLAMYYERVYQSGPAWRSPTIAHANKTSPR